jgi:hypothetical protein
MRLLIVSLTAVLAMVATLTDDDFDVPTTITKQAGAIYAVNSRFGIPPSPDNEYTIVRVDGTVAKNHRRGHHGGPGRH